MILLETKRLVIKAPSLDNFENFHKLGSDPEVMLYIGKGVRTREETLDRITTSLAHLEKHGFCYGDIFEKETSEYVGRAGMSYLEMNDNQPDIELGYTLHKRFWNKGYATELAKALVDWGFQHLTVDKLITVIQPENIASRHVSEKAGLRYVGTDFCYGTDVVRYEILRKDWSRDLVSS